MQQILNNIKERFDVIMSADASSITAPHNYNDSLELLEFLCTLQFARQDMEQPGGAKSRMTIQFEQALSRRRWGSIDNKSNLFKTYPSDHNKVEIPFFKNGISVYWQWHSKDGALYKVLHDVDYFFKHETTMFCYIVTRSESLFEDQRSRDPTRYASTTTHLGSLRRLLTHRNRGLCPVVGLGIRPCAIL